MKKTLILLSTMLLLQGAAQAADNNDGAALYADNCARCHDGGVPRAAGKAVLQTMSAAQITRALSDGAMQQQAALLSESQRATLVTYLASTSTAASNSVADVCAKTTGDYRADLAKPHWNGWSAETSNTRFQSAAQAKLTAQQMGKLKLKWAFGLPEVVSASAQPTVVNGRLFVGSTAGHVYVLDAVSGCQFWNFKSEASVRTAITVQDVNGRALVFFGDQKANAYAVDAATGEAVWRTKVEDYATAFITGAPVYWDGRLYVPVASNEDAYGASPNYECCKFRGSVSALDVKTGTVVWKSYTVPQEPQPTKKNAQGKQLWGPSGAGVWSSPTIDAKLQRLYVTTSNSHSDPVATTSDAFVAFDLKDGKLLWSQQMTQNDGYNLGCDLPAPYDSNCPQGHGPDFDFGSSAMLVSFKDGKRALIAGQKSGVLHALDPDNNGSILWQLTIGKGGKVGGIQWGSATDGETVYVALSDAVISAAAPGTPGAQAALGTAFILDAKAGGGLSAVDARTGKLKWHAPHPGCGDKSGCSPGQSAAVTLLPGVVLSGGLDGHLRAYATGNGEILWDADTMHDYATVNGVAAHGGSLNGPGAIVVNGMLYVNSGYTHLGTAPGNVLLAFSVDSE